jgi:hypothetical protein
VAIGVSAANTRRWTAGGGLRNTTTSENSRAVSASCNGFGIPLALTCPSRASPNSVSIMCAKSLARRDLDAHDGVRFSFVPPVVPDPRLDVGALAGLQHRSLTIAHNGQVAPTDAEALMQRGVQVLTDDACAG